MRWAFFLFLISSCAQVTSLNMQKHEFGILPTKIIWFQIAGLEEEQLAMLRFNQAGEVKTAFEENTCIGKTWSYNLYHLRPEAQASFLAQMTGKKNIKMSCEDADLRPIWSYLGGNGYKTGLLEIGATPKQSLSSLKSCGEKGNIFTQQLYYWVRKEGSPASETFNYRETIELDNEKIYYDQTCDKNQCFSSINDDYKSLYSTFKTTSKKHLFIVRDFSYLAALEKKDFLKAKGILNDLGHSIAEALNESKASVDTLVLVTSGDSRFMDLPDEGRTWSEFEKNKIQPQMRRSKLTNLVIASGARSENFCGLYEDSQIMERILSGPKQLGLELKFLNPFK